MANLFSSIRIKPPKANRFDLSHDVKLTCKFGKLVPILCEDVLPGDVFKGSTEMLVRFAPMIAPVMHRVNVYTHFFFVPKRLLWDEFKTFITGGEDGTETPSYPRIRLTHEAIDGTQGDLFHVGSLCDYLGYPVLNHGQMVNNNAPSEYREIDALPIRAYNLIYNEYYRDQNLMQEIDIQKDMSGVIDLANFPSNASSKATVMLTLKDRCWKKDYFTSALPWAQRGDEIELPLQGFGEVTFHDDKEALLEGEPIKFASSLSSSSHGISYSDGLIKDGTTGQPLKLGNSQIGSGTAIDIPISSVQLQQLIKGVDLSSASAATINELRRAIKAQEFLEVAARGGSRYIEQIYSYFGVRSSDARLQRPEFLGGGKSPVVISDVLQTSQTTDSSPQAQPAGHAVSVQRSHSFKFRAEEHGYIIGIMSIMPMPAYQQGMPRKFSKFDRLDYYWPQFAHLGEQEILNKELYYDVSNPNPASPDATFGYTPRYAEYKFENDTVHGDFRSSLSFWHMGRIFASQPGLNPKFLTNVEDAANRVFAVTDDNVDKIWVNIHHNLKAIRLMPKFGTPLL